MSERWKYQIKMGGIWGVFMTVFNVLFDIKETPFSAQVALLLFILKPSTYLSRNICSRLFYLEIKQKQNL
jgi:hypothetical protein